MLGWFDYILLSSGFTLSKVKFSTINDYFVIRYYAVFEHIASKALIIPFDTCTSSGKK